MGAVDMGRCRKDFDQAVAMYDSGMSVGEVAMAYGVTRQSMHKVLKRRNVTFRPQLRYGDDNHFYRGGSVADDNAQNVLEKATASGKVIRPDKCETCGSTQTFIDGRSSIQGHHTDYNKPLDVMWLCQKCHHKWHIDNRPIARRDNAQ